MPMYYVYPDGDYYSAEEHELEDIIQSGKSDDYKLVEIDADVEDVALRVQVILSEKEGDHPYIYEKEFGGFFELTGDNEYSNISFLTAADTLNVLRMQNKKLSAANKDCIDVLQTVLKELEFRETVQGCHGTLKDSYDAIKQVLLKHSATANACIRQDR